MKLWHKVTIGLIIGLIFGIYLPQYAETVKPIGTIFLRLIQMIILPVIFFSLVSGITGMSDPGSLGRVGVKSVCAFLSTTFFAVIFGMLVAFILKPGYGTEIDLGALPDRDFKANSFDLLEFLVSIVPSNIVGAFAEGKTLQVVFFAIFTGIILNNLGSVADPVKNSVHLMSKIVLKMISKVVELSPYGAFALTAWVVGIQGIDAMISLSKLVFAVVIALGLQYVIFGIFIIVFCKISPMPFYKKSIEYQIVAFSTGSSKASLATTMQVCRQRLGISESSTSFVLPLGASINMDGLAINLSLSVIFFAQIMGVDLSMSEYMIIIFMSTLGSIGGAGIPGGSLIMLPMVLSSVNLPIEGVAIIAGIDRILDLLRTVINITGDATITLIIDSTEGTLDEEVYNNNDI